MEETSRFLHLNSSSKLPLLQQSLTYYQTAESHMEYASFSTDLTIVRAVRQTRSSISFSRSSSVRSSFDSIFSHTSSPISEASSVPSVPSPTSSIYSSTSTPDILGPGHTRAFSEPPTKTSLASRPLKIKKKVAFSLQAPLHLSEADVESNDGSTLLNYFPTPPSSRSVSPPSPPLTPSPSSSSIEDFLLSRALHRYRSHLADLHVQLNQHIRTVEHQIEALQKSRKAWRSNLPNLFTNFSAAGVEGWERRRRRGLS